jgi:hypothetical protein
MCAPKDQRKSGDNQREQAELNALLRQVSGSKVAMWQETRSVCTLDSVTRTMLSDISVLDRQG